MVTLVKERPILFSAPMIRQILNGRKTQTRRVVKPQPHLNMVKGVSGLGGAISTAYFYSNERTMQTRECPHGRIGDRLWVRETFADIADDNRPSCFIYRADGGELSQYHIWKPSIFMPRAASRILLEVTEVRVQRIQEISEEDAIAEGARRFNELPSIHPWGNDPRWSMEQPSSTEDCLNNARFAFANYWEKLNGKTYPWDSNPWVWALTFKVVEVKS